VSNPVCGALVLDILPLGQSEPLDVLCSQNRVLVHERVGASMEGGGFKRNGWFLLGGFRESRVESNVANNFQKT
jgi:hypothetical protein